MKDISEYKLTDDVIVGQARQWMMDKDESAKSNLIKLIHHRFYNRYIKHVKDIKSGFLIMAVSSLMIETLESFKQGEKNTKGKGLKMFKDFFNSEQSLFPEFKDIAEDFYSSIRCGILHQSETTNAWRIMRKDAILDRTTKTINAKKFIKALDKALNNYIDDLKKSDFNTKLWKGAFFKIEDVCENCNANS